MTTTTDPNIQISNYHIDSINNHLSEIGRLHRRIDQIIDIVAKLSADVKELHILIHQINREGRLTEPTGN